MRFVALSLVLSLTTVIAGPPWTRRPATVPKKQVVSELTLKDSKTNTSNDGAQSINNTISRKYVASKWTAGSTYSLVAIDMLMAKGGVTGNPTGDITCNIYYDNTNPAGLLGTSTAIAASTFPAAASPDWLRFSFPTPVNITNNTIYWMVIASSAPENVASYVAAIAPDNFYNGGLVISSNLVDWAVGTSKTWKFRSYAP